MTRAVYIIGGAGTGKSTFMRQLLEGIQYPLGALEDFHTTKNAKGTPVTLRGHRIGDGRGLYIGCMRKDFPGTDGLDRATSITGEEWLAEGKHREFGYLLGEGSTLATRRFLTALHTHTDLLLIQLMADEFTKDLRFIQRGSAQKDTFVQGTATRSMNLLRDMDAIGVTHMTISTDTTGPWEYALDIARLHISSDR